jgi:hypothetical protein
MRLPAGEFEALYPSNWSTPPVDAGILIFVSLPPAAETNVICTTIDGKGNQADRPLTGGPNFIPQPANRLANMFIKNQSKADVRLAYMVFERAPNWRLVRRPAKKKRKA